MVVGISNLGGIQMDLSKYYKPIHITCPKCHYELEFAGKKIVADKNELEDEVNTLRARLQAHKNKYGRDQYFNNLLKQLKEKEAQYTRAKHLVQLLEEQTELQVFSIFKKACMKEFGEEKINKMLKDCEEQLVYNTDDIAKQKYTNFTGA